MKYSDLFLLPLIDMELNYRDKFHIVVNMKVYMDNKDLAKLEEERKIFYNQTYLSTAFGLVGTIAVGCILPGFIYYRRLS